MYRGICMYITIYIHNIQLAHMFYLLRKLVNNKDYNLSIHPPKIKDFMYLRIPNNLFFRFKLSGCQNLKIYNFKRIFI